MDTQSTRKLKQGGNSKGAHAKGGPYSTWRICDSYIHTATWENTRELTENRERRAVHKKDEPFKGNLKQKALIYLLQNRISSKWVWWEGHIWAGFYINAVKLMKLNERTLDRWLLYLWADGLRRLMMMWRKITSLILECSKNIFFWTLIRCDISVECSNLINSNRSLQNIIPRNSKGALCLVSAIEGMSQRIIKWAHSTASSTTFQSCREKLCKDFRLHRHHFISVFRNEAKIIYNFGF